MKFSEIPAGTSYAPAQTLLDGQVLAKVRYRVTPNDPLFDDLNITKKFGALVVIDDTPEAIDRLVREAYEAWTGRGRLEYVVCRPGMTFDNWTVIGQELEDDRTGLARLRAEGAVE